MLVKLSITSPHLTRDRMRTRAGAALDLLDLMIEHPMVTSRWVQQQLQRTQPTVDSLLSEMVKIGLLREITGKNWGRRFSYGEYLKLFKA